ncbi:VOC family protein [Phyllobacterium endophyticum]|uniref:VOC family protein n=1 Tax=Phyllobacterium endophyticum TaxID=1149773 RepID=UPI0011C99EAD|nr:VOC family protein [Phyllobacterium endophyticum]TXR47359.1 VOC family protein [Phyllobacterium endophyticum]
MELKRGRPIDHLHLHSSDLAASKRFYEAVLEVLGIQITDGGVYFFADELWVDSGKSATSVHFAFQAADRETVERFYEAGLKAGGRDNGPPGERHYHPGYYAAYLLDPDGNNVEAVYHGPANKSADFIQITW